MPLYEYRCKACGHRFEKIQTYSAPDAKECPVCKGEVERLISAPSIQFKGSGFYSTDYPSRASKAATAESKAEGKSGEGSSASEGAASGDKSSSSSDKSASADKPSSTSDKGSSTPTGTTPSASPSSSSKQD